MIGGEGSLEVIALEYPHASYFQGGPPPVKKRAVSQSKRKQEDPLPMPFQLPTNFPPRVSDGLEKKTLYGKAHAKFITTIAQAIYRYKSFPTQDEYYHVVQALVKAWPFLDKGQGLVGFVLHSVISVLPVFYAGLICSIPRNCNAFGCQVVIIDFC